VKTSAWENDLCQSKANKPNHQPSKQKLSALHQHKKPKNLHNEDILGGGGRRIEERKNNFCQDWISELFLSLLRTALPKAAIRRDRKVISKN